MLHLISLQTPLPPTYVGFGIVVVFESPPYVTLGIVANSESPHLCCPTGVPHRPSGNTFTIVAYFESSPLCYFWYCIVACCVC